MSMDFDDGGRMIDESIIAELAGENREYRKRIAHLEAECARLRALVEGAPLTVTALVEKCHAIARSKGWHNGADPNDPRQVLAWLALIHSEVSEATEDVRTRRMEATTRADGKPEGFPSELADIVIRCFDVAGALGIDLETAILAKMDFNETRPHRHGGKAA